ncbi:MAG: hypothetical protein VYD70_06445 [Planctomycetota bacterium]|nr:hypothetical protein [Planctomycetota bacterium]
MRPVIFISTMFSVLLGISVIAAAQQSLTIEQGSTQGLVPKTLAITMDATEGVEGFVLAIGFDESLLLVDDFGPVGDSASADFIVTAIYNDGVTLGVVMETEPPFEGDVIASGSGIVIAGLTVTPIISVTADTVATIDFVDGVFNSPTLSNLIVQEGLSIGVGQGLDLNDGALTLQQGPLASMYVEDGSAPADGEGSIGTARVLLDNSEGGVQGFVTSVSHDSTLITLEEISIGVDAETAGAEFVVTQVFDNGGTCGVVLDFQTPFDGHTIPEGVAIHLSSYGYSCNHADIYVEGSTEPPPVGESSTLTLADDLFGDPLLDNVIVIGGLSVAPSLESGTFTCDPVTVPEQDTELWMETFFDEGAGNYAYVGQTGDLCFYYKDDDDYIQGFTFTVCYDCNLTIEEDSWQFNGSILDQVGIEYLATQVDDDPIDGDGCELIVALLLDALPPFEGQTLPQTADLNEGRLLIGKMRVTVDDDAECNEEQPLVWCNDINGNGEVLLYNNVVINFQSVQVYDRHDTFVYVVPEEIFQRGDCNSDDYVDLADPATMLGHQFSGLPILCPDACDSNDDGILNMADSVYLLNWLFQFGPILPDPGPYEDGPDATIDDTLPVCNSDDTSCL